MSARVRVRVSRYVVRMYPSACVYAHEFMQVCKRRLLKRNAWMHAYSRVAMRWMRLTLETAPGFPVNLVAADPDAEYVEYSPYLRAHRKEL